MESFVTSFNTRNGAVFSLGLLHLHKDSIFHGIFYERLFVFRAQIEVMEKEEPEYVVVVELVSDG